MKLSLAACHDRVRALGMAVSSRGMIVELFRNHNPLEPHPYIRIAQTSKNIDLGLVIIHKSDCGTAIKCTEANI